MPRWPRPQVWQHRNGYVPRVCATNSMVVVSPFLSCTQSCGELKTNPGLLLGSEPSGTVAILKPWSWSAAVILRCTFVPAWTGTGEGENPYFLPLSSLTCA